MVTPVTSNPTISTGRRPSASTIRPVNCCAITLPTAIRVSAMPAMGAPIVGTCAASNGTSAIRTPKVAQPFANPDTSRAR